MAGHNVVGACTPCRKVKMKCTPVAGGSKCQRCSRINLECYFESHRRGRKPGAIIRKRTNESSPDDVAEPTDEVDDHGAEEMTHQEPVMSMSQEQRPLPPSQETDGRRRRLSDENHDDEPKELAPSALLNKEAIVGDFSLRNVFNSHGANQTQAASVYGSESVVSPGANDLDPILLGLINLPNAMNLFDSFMKYLDSFVVHFDPALHTFNYVRSRSAFLLTAVLAAAARIFNEGLYGSLRGHAERLLGKVLISGERSTENVQAILLCTYWKEPEDSRSWKLIGYAIRMCTEMRWHRLQPESEEKKRRKMSDTVARERRTIERTWLILFVYDRSISLQVGKPWMIHPDPFLKSAENWHRNKYSVQGKDLLLIAFLRLRKIGFDVLSLSPTAFTSSGPDVENALAQFHQELDEWNQWWQDEAKEIVLEPATRFMIKFYGSHFKLLLNSFKLQILLLQKAENLSPDLPSSMACAQGMMKLIQEELGTSEQLYYVQDSVHVMTVYAAVFLVKMLMLVPEHLPPDSEEEILQLILATSESFSIQATRPQSSCAYQARFLANVVADYRRTKGATNVARKLRKLERKQAVHEARHHRPPPRPLDPELHTSTAQDLGNEQWDSNMDPLRPSLSRETLQGTTAFDPASNPVPWTPSLSNDSGDSPNIQTGGNADMSSTNYFTGLNDNRLWNELFTQAGFNINDGSFVSWLESSN